jgi:ABC-2 type transport system permease protein
MTGLVWALFHTATMLLYTQSITGIGAWGIPDLLLLSAMYSSVIGLFHMFLSRNFERLSRLIRLGELDAILIRPIDTQFAVSLWLINYTAAIRILIGTAMSIWVILTYHVPVTVANIGGMMAMAVVGCGILYSVWMLCAVSIIWYPRLFNIIDLLYSINTVGRYPQSTYIGSGDLLFFFAIPFTAAINTPVRVLLGKISFGEIVLVLVVGLGCVLVSRFIFFRSLRSYVAGGA